MANKLGVISIYLAGRGHYALGSPDGKVLHPGIPLTVLLAGHQVNGIIRSSELGDYLQLQDGDRCGLCACMRVVATIQDIANRYGWPVEKVRNKLYELQQTANHAGNPAAREAESSEQKEDDRGDPLETISVE
jgi:hypothetical protein